jgi:hypothetical protein
MVVDVKGEIRRWSIICILLRIGVEHTLNDFQSAIRDCAVVLLFARCNKERICLECDHSMRMQQHQARIVSTVEANIEGKRRVHRTLTGVRALLVCVWRHGQWRARCAW